ncbi:MAG: hypothetical protein HKN41_12330 [Ilumatobacter sp.]|nr:hypothetical protein [Ilumatobacter sp.]
MTMIGTAFEHGGSRHDDDAALWARGGVALGALGAAAAVWAYWLVLPGIIFGVAALVLGVRGRRKAPQAAAGSVAIALGVVALLLVPSVWVVVDGAEDWGRECTLNPSNPDC